MTSAAAAVPGSLSMGDTDTARRAQLQVVKYLTSVTAAVAAEVVTFPADLIKTRLQIQGSGQAGKTSFGVVGMIGDLLKKEGVRGLFGGLTASCQRHFIYSGARMSMYETIREDVFGRNADGSFPLWKSVLAGMTCGACAQFMATPCDGVKVQMQMEGQRRSQGLPTRFNGTIDAYRLLAKGGLPGLWRGAIPSCQRAAMVQLGDLTTYDFAKQKTVKVLGDTVACHFVCSMAAGFSGAFFSCPADVIKSRVMSQDPTNPVYKGSLDCLTQTVSKEGVLALWKGFLPAWARCGPWSLVFFLSFEQLRKATGQAGYCS
mmetsp:Transcript_53136/g.121393  ORF Transcript_53136/g.121393 Transcript_53136/m.121393 type:complete len:317 (+) Transcript_53136:55-1005(+)